MTDFYGDGATSWTIDTDTTFSGQITYDEATPALPSSDATNAAYDYTSLSISFSNGVSASGFDTSFFQLSTDLRQDFLYTGNTSNDLPNLLFIDVFFGVDGAGGLADSSLASLRSMVEAGVFDLKGFFFGLENGAHSFGTCDDQFGCAFEGGLTSITISPATTTAVPAPASALLLASGLAALGFGRRRKSRAANA